MVSIGRAAAERAGALSTRAVRPTRWRGRSTEPVPLILSWPAGPAETPIEKPKSNDVAEDVSLTACATRSSSTTCEPSPLGDGSGRVSMYTEPKRPTQARRIAIARIGTRVTVFRHRRANGSGRSLGRVGELPEREARADRQGDRGHDHERS